LLEYYYSFNTTRLYTKLNFVRNVYFGQKDKKLLCFEILNKRYIRTGIIFSHDGVILCMYSYKICMQPQPVLILPTHRGMLQAESTCMPGSVPRWFTHPNMITHAGTSSSSSGMRVINHNWSARKHHLHLQSVARISCHSALSEDRIRQRWTSRH